MQKTYKYRIYPTKEQTEKLDRTLDICRILYNSYLVDRKNPYEKTGKGLSYNQQAGILTLDKKKILILKEIHSQVLQDVLFRVERAYRNFFRRLKIKNKKAGYPRFKSEGKYDSITYPQLPGFEVTEQGLNLSKIVTIKLKKHRDYTGNLKTCTIKKEIEKWYVCLSVEYACEPVERDVISKPVGIDMGITSFVATSDGKTIDNPKYLIKSENNLKKLQKRLSRKTKGSNNRKRAIKKVAVLHKHVFNQRKDFQHKFSGEIVNNYDMIAVEKLKIRNMVRNPYLSKSISDSGWGQFLNMLEYKAAEAGIPFFRIEPQYTSIDCNNCGTKVPKTLANRMHICPKCNIVIDRDINATINIKQKAINKIRQELPEYTVAELSSVDDRKEEITYLKSILSLKQEASSDRAR